jgi:adenosylhomocysteine nucleosidase/futalosine hydrolase
MDFRTRYSKMAKKIVVISPTGPEIEPFLASRHAGKATVHVCGAGMAEAARMTHAVLKDRPDLVILAGIAGRYPSSRLAVGDVALVGSERVADLGAMRSDGFRPLFQKEYECPHALKYSDFPVVAANTVNTAASPLADHSDADLENMEGAAFFALCAEAGVPFLELRAVSNTVSSGRGDWNIELATRNLADALERISNDF